MKLIEYPKGINMVTNDSFYSCNCGCEVLVMRQYDNEPMIEFGIFINSPRNMRFLDRIKFAFRMIFKNEYHTDQIMLDFKQTCRLRDNLTWMITNMDVNNG